MTQRGCPACQDRNEYNESRAHAYRLLLAYAECRRAPRESFELEEYEAACKKHGWDGKQPKSQFLEGLRLEALQAARAAEAT